MSDGTSATTGGAPSGGSGRGSGAGLRGAAADPAGRGWRGAPPAHRPRCPALRWPCPAPIPKRDTAGLPCSAFARFLLFIERAADREIDVARPPACRSAAGYKSRPWRYRRPPCRSARRFGSAGATLLGPMPASLARSSKFQGPREPFPASARQCGCHSSHRDQCKRPPIAKHGDCCQFALTTADRRVAPRRAVRRLSGRLVADLRRYAVAADGAAARRPREVPSGRRSNCQSRLTTRAKNSRPYAGPALGPASAGSFGTCL